MGGYRETLIAGEEPDMCRRMRGLGYTIQHVDVPMTMHDIDMHTAKQYWRRCVRSGYAYAEVSSMHASTDDPLWSRESRNNVIRGSFWVAFAAVSVIAALGFRRWLPVEFFLAALALLTLRTAAGVRIRVSAWSTRLAYGLVSHLQHVPILIGQMRYWTARRNRQASGIIEYK